MVLSLAVSLVGTKWQRTHRDKLIFSCLDVGHGQAILVQLPGTANVLFDAGSLHRSDVGRRVVVPFLDYIGTRRIDAIIISHSDIDHINGIPEIIEQCAVGSIFASDVFLDSSRQSVLVSAQRAGAGPEPGQTDQANVAFLTGQLEEDGMEIQRIHNGIHIRTPARIHMLWPTNQAAQDGELSDNDKSLVCLIEFANTRVLLCSDIEVYAQEQLLALYPELKADVVLVPHHGLARTLSDSFLQALDAEVLVCSCGRSEHQKGRTIKSCLSTAEHGAIIVCIDESGTIRHHVTINENERDTGR
jgi:competence protein ComEC